MALPAPAYNFASLPIAQDPVVDATLPLARGQGLLPGAPRGWRETLVVDPGTGRPSHVAMLPGNTLLPLVTAAAISSLVALMLAGLYALVPLALALIVAVVWRWGGIIGTDCDHAHVAVAPDLDLPLHWHCRRSLAWCGAVATLGAVGALFASLLFDVAFLSVVAPGWPAPQSGIASVGLALFGGIAVGLLALGSLAARRAEGTRAIGVAKRWAILGTVCGTAASVTLVMTVPMLDDPRRHARDALRAILLAYIGVQVTIATLLALRTALDARHNRVSQTRYGTPPVWRLWQDFAAGTAAIAAAVIALQELP